MPPSAGTTPSQSLNASINRLKLEQRRLKNSKKQIVKELRNAERKRKRLRERARQLKDEDLLAAMLMRAEIQRSRRPQVAQKTQRATRTLARQSTALAPEPCAVNHAQQRSPSRVSPACLDAAPAAVLPAWAAIATAGRARGSVMRVVYRLLGPSG